MKKQLILNFFTLSAVICILISTSTAVRGGDTPAKIKRAASIGVGTLGDTDPDSMEKTIQVDIVLNRSIPGWNKILLTLTDRSIKGEKRMYGYGFSLKNDGGDRILFELRTGENKSVIDTFEVHIGTDNEREILRWNFKINLESSARKVSGERLGFPVNLEMFRNFGKIPNIDGKARLFQQSSARKVSGEP